MAEREDEICYAIRRRWYDDCVHTHTHWFLWRSSAAGSVVALARKDQDKENGNLEHGSHEDGSSRPSSTTLGSNKAVVARGERWLLHGSGYCWFQT